MFTTGDQQVLGQSRSTSVDRALVDAVMQAVVGQRMVVATAEKPGITGRVTSVMITPDALGNEFIVLNVEFLEE